MLEGNGSEWEKIIENCNDAIEDKELFYSVLSIAFAVFLVAQIVFSVEVAGWCSILTYYYLSKKFIIWQK